MNRSFRAPESQMQMASKQRQEIGSLMTSMMKEKEEELALFLEMRKREKERNNLLLQNSEEFDAPHGGDPRIIALRLQPNLQPGLHVGAGSDLTTYALLE